MLQAALESEVEAFLAQHAARVDDQGHRQVVRNGHLPARDHDGGWTAGGRPAARAGQVPSILKRVKFSSSTVEELIPWLYLKGISTGDFSEALSALVGPEASGFSANVVGRLKKQWSQEYDEWSKRGTLTAKDCLAEASKRRQGGACLGLTASGLLERLIVEVGIKSDH